jgi:hypothetical protein
MNIPDHFSESLETVFRAKMYLKILKFFDVDPISGMVKFGSGINFPDHQHWSN